MGCLHRVPLLEAQGPSQKRGGKMTRARGGGCFQRNVFLIQQGKGTHELNDYDSRHEARVSSRQTEIPALARGVGQEGTEKILVFDIYQEMESQFSLLV